jgi:hypothetical protein
VASLLTNLPWRRTLANPFRKGLAPKQLGPGHTINGKKQFLLLFVVLLSLCGGARAQVVIRSTTTILIDRREPFAVQKAAADLASDMTTVFGTRPKMVGTPADATLTTICVALNYNLPSAVEKPSGWEVLRVQAVKNPWAGSHVQDAVVLTGSDVLGTIYAIYQFSQQFLGVDPLYWWTDDAPKRQDRVIVPAGFDETQGTPTFKFRGWFINDEDLLTGWRPGIADGTGISLRVWNRIFEALLRLKGNMIVPGTFIFPYEPQVRAALQRGLFIAQHHVEPLGLNTYRWPKSKPYSFVNFPDLLESAWRTAVEQYPSNAKIVWTVGYRGENDEPFWISDKSAPKTDKGRAQVIGAAVEAQIRIVRETRLSLHNQFVFNAWQEGARFIRAGLLTLPADVPLVWPDDGHGLIQDGGLISKGEGVYYHTAMYDGHADHLTEGIPLERIRSELGRAVRAGATDYLLVNTSNFRPVLMTTRAVMELAWNAQPWTAEHHDQSSAYSDKWCREEFGLRAAALVSQYYKAYFAAPARYGKQPDATMEDNFYQTEARNILLALIKGQQGSPAHFFLIPHFPDLVSYARFIATRCQKANGRWEQAYQIAKRAEQRVPADRRNFFQASILSQVDVQRYSSEMLMDVAEAAAPGLSPTARLARINSAIHGIESVERALRSADYGKWNGFYTRGDWLVDIPSTLNLARAYDCKLRGLRVPLDPVIRAEDHAFAYWMIKAYQGGERDHFQRFR